MNLGADDYITKPVDDVEMLNAIDIRIKKHAALQKLPRLKPYHSTHLNPQNQIHEREGGGRGKVA